MALNGWHWTIFGAIIAAAAGYIYLKVPKDGGPNTVMALFFFIGLVFIIIGVIKIFFRKVDDKNVFDSVQKSENTNEVQMLNSAAVQSNQNNKLNVQMDIVKPIESKPNKIDEAINNMAKTHEKKHVQAHTGTHSLQTGHSNSYAKTHHYHGPAKTAAVASANAAHPIHSHVEQKIVNTHEHSIKCKKCGNVNPGNSNYCHSCGSRLK